MRTGVLVGAALTALVAPTFGQRAEFEVATVKVPPPVAFGAPLNINLGTYRNRTLTLTNVTLAECVQFAYRLGSADQIEGPDWIKSRDVRFDIVAKTGPDTDLDSARGMLQSLLADRLKTSVRIEQRRMRFLALVPAKRGVKLVSSTPASSAAPATTSVQGHIVGAQMPMAVLASLLSRFERELVVDKTGLSGNYQLTLNWAPDGLSGPSLSDALEEQLGLQVEARREPLDVAVVERAERVPVDN